MTQDAVLVLREDAVVVAVGLAEEGGRVLFLFLASDVPVVIKIPGDDGSSELSFKR